MCPPPLLPLPSHACAPANPPSLHPRLPAAAEANTDGDWEAWEGVNVADLDDITEVAELREAVIERRRLRGGRRSKVRDEYMRPIVDAQVGVDTSCCQVATVAVRVGVVGMLCDKTECAVQCILASEC